MATHRNRPFIEFPTLILIVLGIALVTAGFLLASIYDETHKLVTKLISVGATELGFAFLIAAIVYKLFEETVKRDEAKGVAAFLYGIETDSEYFRMIEDYIIRCPFYRFDTLITYKFVDKHGEAYLIDYCIEYKVKNVSKVRKKFKITGEVETKPIHHAGTPGWKVGTVEAVVIQNETATRPPLPLVDAVSSPHTKAFSSQDFTLKAREAIHVTISHKIEKHDHDADFWQAVMPCSGVKLRIEWPERWALRFAEEAFHPEADSLQREQGKDGTTCWREMTLDQPFMARHGLRFWWASDAGAITPLREPVPAVIAPAADGTA